MYIISWKFQLATLCFINKYPWLLYYNKKEMLKKINDSGFYSLSVRCWFCFLKYDEGWLIRSGVATGGWCTSCWHTHKYILVDKVYGFWDKMCYSLCMWLAFLFYFLTFTVVIALLMFLIIPIYCDLFNWYRLDSAGYYPAAHSRHLCVNCRVLWTGTSHSPRDITNKSTTGNQWSARITLK